MGYNTHVHIVDNQAPVKVVSFQILEHIEGGVADVFLSHGTLNDQEIESWEDHMDSLDEQEFPFEYYKQKLFTIVNNTFLQDKSIGSEGHEMYYVCKKDRPEVIDYYMMVQKYMSEFCEFVDQEYAVYFKVNSL